MKKIYVMIATAALAAVSCINPDSDIKFGVDLGVEDGVIAVGPEGGVAKINVTSPGEWVVMTESPWITVSPANGRGSTECVVSIDSTLAFSLREGAVRIQSLSDNEQKHDFTVSQAGFAPQITLDKKTVEVADFADFNSREFDVTVRSNVAFNVNIPEDAQKWLSYEAVPADLDRGARPRSTRIHFEWKVNSRDQQRLADVTFSPVEDITLEINDAINSTG